MSVVNTTALTSSERRSSQKYRFEVIGAGAVYAIAIMVSSTYVRGTHGPSKIALALLPMVGVVGMALAMVRYAIRSDELQRRTIIVSAAISAVVTAVVTMLLGFLENAGLPAVPLWIVWPLIVGSFGISMPLVGRRYR